MTNKKPALLLLPNLLGESRHHEMFLPASVDAAVATLDGVIAESESGARRFLSHFKHEKRPHEIPVALYNEHTLDTDLEFLLEPIRKGERWGLISDAGVPCVADPGFKLVRRARESGIIVQAFVGPSSILLALMQSGLPGQKFMFHGYLNKEQEKRGKQVADLERSSERESCTHIFIEAPYRNKHLLDTLINTLKEDTRLCVAWDLTLPTQGIVSQTLAVWKKSPLPNLEKKPAIFLISV